MATEGDNYARMPGEPESGARQAGRCACKYCGLGCLCVFVLVALLQSALFYWATINCGAKKLENYSYPGGGPVELVPSNTLLIEQEPTFFSSSFIVQPADDVGLAQGASTGVYFRTWGPVWWTYVYQDYLGKGTFYVRDRPLALGGSHKISRCDGTGPTYIVSEGTHVIMNSIREMFGMYTSRVYNIWQDSKLVALSEKVGGARQSHKQIVFRGPKEAIPFASAFLTERHYHGSFDKWFVHDEAGETKLPAWVPNAATALMAFPAAQAKRKKQQAADAAKAPSTFDAAPTSLEEAADAAQAPSAFEAAPTGLEEAAPAALAGTPKSEDKDFFPIELGPEEQHV